MAPRTRSIDRIATEQVRIVPGNSGNFAVSVGTNFAHVVSVFGSENDAMVAVRRLQIWLMGVLIADRRDKGGT